MSEGNPDSALEAAAWLLHDETGAAFPGLRDRARSVSTGCYAKVLEYRPALAAGRRPSSREGDAR